MGEYHSIFPSPASVLNHILFTIGSGYHIDEETQSPIGNEDKRPIHLFPKFNKEKMIKKRMPAWRQYIEQRAERGEETQKSMENLHKKLGKERQSNWNKEEFIKQELAKYFFPDITPEDLTIDNLYQQLVEEENNPRRNVLSGEYKYVRPYPLSERHSLVYELNDNSPGCVREVAMNFCTAWLNYLNNEIECDRVYEEGGYSNLEWTTKHRDMIYNLTVQQLAQAVTTATTHSLNLKSQPHPDK
jgi:hypothetical protein